MGQDDAPLAVVSAQTIERSPVTLAQYVATIVTAVADDPPHGNAPGAEHTGIEDAFGGTACEHRMVGIQYD